MRLTVVVPIYNVEGYLRKCVDSIIAQTYKSISIILVDDGSTDLSGSIADAYAAQYKNIQVIHQKNQGLSGARNAGIDNCKTELITFVDSDDYIEPDMYEVLVKAIDEKSADISIGGVFRESITGEKHSVYPVGIRKIFSKEEALIELNSLKYFNMSVCNVVFRASLFNTDIYGDEMVRFPVGKKSEDEYTTHKLYARANRVIYSSTPYYHYLERPGSITTASKINTEQLDAAETRVRFYEKWFPEIVYSAKSECVFTCMALTNVFLRRNLQCPVELEKKMRTLSRCYLGDIIMNGSIKLKKKIQAVIFIVMPDIYKFILRTVGKVTKR